MPAMFCETREGGVAASEGIALRIPPEDLTRVCHGYGNLFWLQEERALLNAPNYTSSHELSPTDQKAEGGGKMIIGSDFMSGLTIQAPVAVS